MGPQLVDVAQRLADSGKQVIISGLDTDYLGARSPPSRTCWRKPNPSPRRLPSACAAGTPPSTRNACAGRKT